MSFTQETRVQNALDDDKMAGEIMVQNAFADDVARNIWFGPYSEAVGKVLPQLNGKLTGMAFRVPTQAGQCRFTPGCPRVDPRLTPG